MTNSTKKKLVRILIYIVLTASCTRYIFINAPDGEFFNNETKIINAIDYIFRINFSQIFLIIVPVFLIIFLIFESIYFILTKFNNLK